MFGNFIGGGQVFLHRFRMFKQVVISTFKTSLLIGIIGGFVLKLPQSKSVNIAVSFSYIKAKIVLYIYDIMPSYSGLRGTPLIDIYTRKGIRKSDVPAKWVIQSKELGDEYKNFIAFLYDYLLSVFFVTSLSMIVIFVFWTKFGKFAQADKKIKGDEVLDAKTTRRILNLLGKASKLKISDMPLVKGSETRHFLLAGSTGVGKTNLMHNMISQIESDKQPIIVIDQTGEMIAKYYDKERGDIIFNPFDVRCCAWDFWKDCESQKDLERFANVLFSFYRKKQSHSSDPFWEKSAETVFVSCVMYLQEIDKKDLALLNKLIKKSSLQELMPILEKYDASRYLNMSNNSTAASILSVLATSAKPLSYLDYSVSNKKFSLKEYFNGLKKGKNGWLFLATEPGNRELTLPIISCLTDLSVSMLMEIGIDSSRRVWFVIDELAALGRLPAMNNLMSEGRKYGACVLAGLQSLNQLYSHYGQYDGSTVLGQFATKFFFRTDEPIIAKMISSMCGTKTITQQQKNTSFGANTYRDGQSYTEQERSRNLVDYSDLTKLEVGQCYALLPQPEVRITKIQVLENKLPDKNIGFEPIEQDAFTEEIEGDCELFTEETDDNELSLLFEEGYEYEGHTSPKYPEEDKKINIKKHSCKKNLF